MAAAERVVDAAAPGRPFDLVWQSRSGPPSVPWLEPDVNDHLRALAAAGETAVVVFPVGFISDHLEVIWDLDNEAKETAAELGLAFARAGTAGTHPAFVAAVRELLEERRAGGTAAAGHQLPGDLLFRAAARAPRADRSRPDGRDLAVVPAAERPWRQDEDDRRRHRRPQVRAAVVGHPVGEPGEEATGDARRTAG